MVQRCSNLIQSKKFDTFEFDFKETGILHWGLNNKRGSKILKKNSLQAKVKREIHSGCGIFQNKDILLKPQKQQAGYFLE